MSTCFVPEPHSSEMLHTHPPCLLSVTQTQHGEDTWWVVLALCSAEWYLLPVVCSSAPIHGWGTVLGCLQCLTIFWQRDPVQSPLMSYAGLRFQMVVLLSMPLGLGRPSSDFSLRKLVVHNPEVGRLWNPRLCAVWPLPSVTCLGLPSVPEPWDQGRTSTNTRNGAGDPDWVTVASAWSCWRCQETALKDWSSIKSNSAFQREQLNNKFNWIFYYVLSLMCSYSSMDPINSLSASCFCCGWKCPIIPFYAFSELFFIFLYFIVLSHPLCQAVFFCIILNSLSFKEIIFISRKCYMV